MTLTFGSSRCPAVDRNLFVVTSCEILCWWEYWHLHFAVHFTSLVRNTMTVVASDTKGIHGLHSSGPHLVFLQHASSRATGNFRYRCLLWNEWSPVASRHMDETVRIEATVHAPVICDRPVDCKLKTSPQTWCCRLKTVECSLRWKSMSAVRFSTVASL